MDKDFVTIELSVLFRGFVRRKAMLRKLKNKNKINFSKIFQEIWTKLYKANIQQQKEQILKS